ncbi:hypothetical protein GCM10022221_20680 [Actinocorallia aurea]
MTHALEDLRREVGSAEADVRVSADHAWQAFLRFARVRYNVAELPDADGLLFQFGTHALSGTRAFVLNFTRQFEITDAAGEHDHYLQVQCELEYEPTPSLEGLGTFSSWFFHDSGEGVEDWRESLRNSPMWGEVDRLTARLAVFADQV